MVVDFFYVKRYKNTRISVWKGRTVEIIEGIDKFILSFCTKFSHWLQRTFGRTNYFVAKIGVFLAFSSVIVDIVNSFYPIVKQKGSLVMLPLYIVLLFSMIRDAWLCNENEIRLQEGRTLRDVYGYTGPGWRFLWLVISLFHLFTLFSFTSVLDLVSRSFFGWGSCIFYFFVAVVPLPPGRSKVRKLLDRLAPFLAKPIPVPTSNCTSHPV